MFFIKHEIHKIANTHNQWSINITHENRTWVNKKVSVQIQCEDHIIIKIYNQAQCSLKQENHQNLFNLQGICMSYTN